MPIRINSPMATPSVMPTISGVLYRGAFEVSGATHVLDVEVGNAVATVEFDKIVKDGDGRGNSPFPSRDCVGL